MPLYKIDYSKTLIYKIVSNDLNITDCYVGTTTDFTKRKWAHKSSCTSYTNKAYNYNIYTFIRNNGGWENWDMIEIEKFPCNDINEAHARERYYIETLNATLNKVIPSRTRKETTHANYIKSKLDKQEYSKLYNLENRDKINQRRAKYLKNNRDKINAYQRELRAKKKLLDSDSK